MKLTVCGSFGFGNAGDEAIPLAICDMLSEIQKEASLTVLCRYDRPDMPDILGVGIIDADQRKKISTHPCIVSGGGIIEAEAHSTINRCSVFFKTELKAKMAFIGISADYGVRYRWIDRIRFSFLMRRTGTVYARDVLSAETIEKNFPFVNVETVGDLVLWMKPSRYPAELPPLPREYIAVTLAPRWQDPSWLEWISSELADLAKKKNAALVFVPMSCLHDDDRIEHRKVAQRILEEHPDVCVHEIRAPLPPRELAATFGGSVFTISMRLHGCVMAYAQKVPFVALAYHPKLAGFVRTIEAPSAILPETLPQQQSEATYGYRFAELHLRSGDLAKRVDQVEREISFEPLARLKKKSLDALKRFLAIQP